ncbi:hypothetical protein [Pampinifervens florentissimum]|uniref:hypothetical protein n=1 Tax=Pampinifervens florentissimum TaxID=1632019 RepID=UPI0013B486DC|nr:hypothetical protein [Hydrogenobacter sp. T-8]QID32325.1 hypothetical protein G3M65_00425 [Hydrogenobacter sp. T-8]
MWQKIENGITELIKQVAQIENVQLWSGKPEDLLKRPNTYPAIRVIVQKHDLKSFDIFDASYESVFDISLLVFYKSLRDDGTGAYSIIDRLYKLNNHVVNGYTIKPRGSQLLMSDTSEFIFEVKFVAEGKEVLYKEDEVLTRRIDFEEVVS